jgi:anaerobic magnesium-protoporphyrin IX monomethyl ester cyclase
VSAVDLLLVNPGGRDQVYQTLGGDLTAIEPPLWVRLTAGYLLDRGFSLEILDSEAEQLGPVSVAQIIAERKPVLTGIVVFGHQPSASTQQMTAAGAICRAIKHQTPEQKIILLGGHVSALPVRTAREESVDYCCKGEGPITLHLLLEALRKSSVTRLDEIPGLVWQSGKEILVNEPAPIIQDLDRHLHGNVWHLLPMEKYRAHNWQCFGNLGSRQPYASIYTSLGCPYKCTFCCINSPFGSNRYRMRTAAGVAAEVELLYRTYGVKTFKIGDEMFVLNDRHVTAVCELLASKPYAPELNIWAYSRIDTLKPERLALLRAAGIRWLALGIESGSEHVRDGAEKRLESRDIVEIVSEIKKAGINVIGNYIFGLPDDDLATMNETLALARELNCEFANFYCAMAYPGSPLYDVARQRGWALPDNWIGFSQHSYECRPLPTERLTAREVLRFRDYAFHEYFSNPRYLEMVTSKFGQETRGHIATMASVRLRRKLFEETEAGADS